MAAIGWSILFAVMTLIFPLAGARGGFFHAGAAFQMFWWSLAPLGLSHFVEALRKRGILTAKHVGTVFQGMLVTVCVLLSGIIVQIRILQSGWEPDLKLYSQVTVSTSIHYNIILYFLEHFQIWGNLYQT